MIQVAANVVSVIGSLLVFLILITIGANLIFQSYFKYRKDFELWQECRRRKEENHG